MWSSAFPTTLRAVIFTGFIATGILATGRSTDTIIKAAFRSRNTAFDVPSDQEESYEHESLPHGVGGIQAIRLQENKFNNKTPLSEKGTIIQAKVENGASNGPRCYFWSDTNNCSPVFYDGSPLRKRHENSEYMQCYTLDSPDDQVVLSVKNNFRKERMVKLAFNGKSVVQILYLDILEEIWGPKDHAISRIEILEAPAEQDIVCYVTRHSSDDLSTAPSARVNAPLDQEVYLPDKAYGIRCQNETFIL